MSAIVGERDKALQATFPRNINPTLGKSLSLDVDPPAFHQNSAGIPTFPAATFTATPNGFAATVLWSITSGGKLTGTTPSQRTLLFSDMTADMVKVTATVVYNGQAYIAVRTIYKVIDGKPGKDADPASAQTAAQLKDILIGQISKDQLTLDLQTLISPVSVAGSLAAQIKAETDQRVTAISGEISARSNAISAAIAAEVGDRTTYIQTYSYSKQASDQSLSQQATQIAAAYKSYTDAATGKSFTDAKAFVQSYTYSIADANSAITQMANQLRSEFSTSTGGATQAYVQSWAYSKADTDTAETAQFNSLTSNYQSYGQALQGQTLSASAADVRSYTYAKSTIDGSISYAIQQLRSEFVGSGGATEGYVANYAYSKADIDKAETSQTNTLTASYQAYGQALQNQTLSASAADVRLFTYGKATIDGAIAYSTNTVSARLNNLNGTGATVEQVISSTANAVSGLSAQWTVKLNAGGAISGIGLSSTDAYGVPSSAFAVVADRFSLQYPGLASQIPFAIGRVAGQSVIGLNGNLVLDGTFNLRAADGSVIISAGQSLAQQTKTGINLVPRISDWPIASRVNAALAVNTGDASTINGEFVDIVGSGGSAYCGMSSPALGIPAGAFYAVSFDARADGARNITVDVAGTGVDSNGKYVGITATTQHFSFYEQMPSGTNGDAVLRVFSTEPGSRGLISNIKVEIGQVSTAWTDDVISAGNSAQRVLPKSLNQTQFGGDISSDNWNGSLGLSGAGWLLQRATGNFYGNSMILRGSIANGGHSAWGVWPGAGGAGYYVGAEGFQIGSMPGNKYFYVTADGNIYAPGFRVENSQVYLDKPTITGGILDAFYSNNSGGISGTWPNGSSTYGTMSMNIVGGRAPFSYYWFINYGNSSGSVKVKLNFQGGTPTGPTATLQGTGTSDDLDGTVMCICIDANGRAVTAAFPFYVRHGVPP